MDKLLLIQDAEHKRVWLVIQKTMGLLVGGNHTSSRFCTR
ncbi:PREDICTED: uncharacterized protein LOC103342123 isoform X2 [Prunus mume]|uniref:Uncharacterized protein LOC103342123 isoform X2 n=1 Tax=Prunus mume TaxID=102107 RepID=A0ABM0PSR4_PRUMU|nr:PREDICTED: uncharacterized protein LOC103342123 isoform X2 [Prunus mume]